MKKINLSKTTELISGKKYEKKEKFLSGEAQRDRIFISSPKQFM
ncbi:MAG: hypothetical protein ACHBN1_20250 [Heteroscytonema crispum UTEX LB 1556]